MAKPATLQDGLVVHPRELPSDEVLRRTHEYLSRVTTKSALERRPPTHVRLVEPVAPAVVSPRRRRGPRNRIDDRLEYALTSAGAAAQLDVATPAAAAPPEPPPAPAPPRRSARARIDLEELRAELTAGGPSAGLAALAPSPLHEAALVVSPTAAARARIASRVRAPLAGADAIQRAPAVPRQLPVLRDPVEVGAITDASDRFRCQPYRAVISADCCVTRQRDLAAADNVAGNSSAAHRARVRANLAAGCRDCKQGPLVAKRLREIATVAEKGKQP